jgi:molybdopterin synthase sulfur carrier subunit
VARLRLFGPAREAAGTAVTAVPGRDVGDVLDAACASFGAEFVEVLARSAVWLNGEPAGRGSPVGVEDEVAVLPPVSGG